MKIRIRFAKYGVMKFVGHLDMMRYFQKAIRRAGIDIAYTAGFSPHQIMSFAAPLGVGLTSDSEYVDIEVNSTGSSKEAVSALNAVMADGVEVKSYRKLPDDGIYGTEGDPDHKENEEKRGCHGSEADDLRAL